MGLGGLLGEHYSWIGGRVNTPPTRPLDIVLTSNRKLGRGGVELRGAAPEKGRTNTQEKEPFGKKGRKTFCALLEGGGGEK